MGSMLWGRFVLGSVGRVVKGVLGFWSRWVGVYGWVVLWFLFGLGGLWVGCMLWVCRWGSGAVSCGVGCWCQVGLGLVEESSSMVLLNGMGFVRVGLVGAWIGEEGLKR